MMKTAGASVNGAGMSAGRNGAGIRNGGAGTNITGIEPKHWAPKTALSTAAAANKCVSTPPKLPPKTKA